MSKRYELANTIRATSFTKDNYEQLLDKLHNENIKATYDEENTYDNETDHGIITAKQQEWQQTLKEKIKTVGCY